MNTLSHFLLTGLVLLTGSISFAQIAGGQNLSLQNATAMVEPHRPSLTATTDIIRTGDGVRLTVDELYRDRGVTWQYSLDDGASFSSILSGPSLEIDRTEPWMHLVQIRVAATLPGSTVYSDPVVLILQTTPRDGDHI